MNRADIFRALSNKEIAIKVVEYGLLDCYCRGVCVDQDSGEIYCTKENETICVQRWLEEEIPDGRDVK
ncbi:MAG: hypothetical protein AB6733_00105 [Clostridiaceae bacterium]